MYLLLKSKAGPDNGGRPMVACTLPHAQEHFKWSDPETLTVAAPCISQEGALSRIGDVTPHHLSTPPHRENICCRATNARTLVSHVVLIRAIDTLLRPLLQFLSSCPNSPKSRPSPCSSRFCAETPGVSANDEDAPPTLAVKSKGAEKPTKGRKAKAGKDPNKPKRAPNAFFVLMGEFRKEFKEKNPKIKSVAAVGKAVGDRWKSLSESDKAPYVAKANKLK
uniref:HMG box domain-containing protein n=1 Tax=Zea mays TaxID=4577 RepID=A0A804PVK3_MAIZE